MDLNIHFITCMICSLVEIFYQTNLNFKFLLKQKKTDFNYLVYQIFGMTVGD